MNTAIAIRPPWPDELARLAQAFPDLRITRTCRPLVLVAIEPYERLVGAALVMPPQDEAPTRTCELAWQVRSRFADQSGPLLKAAAESLAPGESLVWQERTPEGATGSSAPTEAGFSCTQTHEVWSIPLANCFARRNPYSEALRRRGQACGYATAAALPQYRDGIIALVTNSGLLNESRVRFSDEHPAGYDRELSTVVVRRAEVVAAVLVRREPSRAIVETRVVAPAHVGRFNLPNALLLDRSLGVAEGLGLTDVVLTADPANAKETIRFARRCGGSRQSTLRLWHFGA